MELNRGQAKCFEIKISTLLFSLLSISLRISSKSQCWPVSMSSITNQDLTCTCNLQNNNFDPLLGLSAMNLPKTEEKKSTHFWAQCGTAVNITKWASWKTTCMDKFVRKFDLRELMAFTYFLVLSSLRYEHNVQVVQICSMFHVQSAFLPKGKKHLFDCTFFKILSLSRDLSAVSIVSSDRCNITYWRLLCFII